MQPDSDSHSTFLEGCACENEQSGQYWSGLVGSESKGISFMLLCYCQFVILLNIDL